MQHRYAYNTVKEEKVPGLFAKSGGVDVLIRD